MKKSLVRVSHSLMQPVRVCTQQVPRGPSCFLTAQPQHSVRGFSLSGILEQKDQSVQKRQQKVLERTEDSSAAEEIATTDSGERNSTVGQRAGDPTPDTGSLGKFVGEDDFEAWITQTLGGDRYNRQRYLNWERGVTIRAMTTRKNEGTTVSVNFDDYATTNTLKSALLPGLTNAFNKIAATEKINGVCLTSGHPNFKDTHFCAGANLQNLQDLGAPDKAEVFIRRISGLCTAIRNTSVPVVALISKACIGAGLEVAASCDIRVATEDAKFSMPEVLLGIPSVVQARLLCDIVGWARARHLMLTGDTWTAQEAYEAGLVTKIFKNKEEMHKWATIYMQRLNSDSVVYREQKKLMIDWEKQSVEEGIEAGARCFADAFAREDRVEKIKQKIGELLKKSSSKNKTDKQIEKKPSANGDEVVE